MTQQPPPPVFQHAKPTPSFDRAAPVAGDYLALLLALAAPFAASLLSIAIGLGSLLVYAGISGCAWYLAEDSKAWSPREKLSLKVAMTAPLVLYSAMFLLFTLVPEDVLGNGLGPGLVFSFLLLVAIGNLLAQIVRLWGVATFSGRNSASR